MTDKRDPRVRKFVDYAFQTYRAKYGERLVITGADTFNTKRVLITVELERLKQYWDWFLHYTGDDWQLKSATRDIKTFCGLINRIIQQSKITGQDDRDTTIPTDFDLLYEQMFDYVNTMLQPETKEHARWYQALEAVKDIDQLTLFDHAFSDHLKGISPAETYISST